MIDESGDISHGMQANEHYPSSHHGMASMLPYRFLPTGCPTVPCPALFGHLPYMKPFGKTRTLSHSIRMEYDSNCYTTSEGNDILQVFLKDGPKFLSQSLEVSHAVRKMQIGR